MSVGDEKDRILEEESPGPSDLESVLLQDEGNVPGKGGESPYCYKCGKLLIERYGFRVLSIHLRTGCCPECWTRIDGVGITDDRS